MKQTQTLSERSVQAVHHKPPIEDWGLGHQRAMVYWGIYIAIIAALMMAL